MTRTSADEIAEVEAILLGALADGNWRGALVCELERFAERRQRKHIPEALASLIARGKVFSEPLYTIAEKPDSGSERG